jgi:hypothetical protein
LGGIYKKKFLFVDGETGRTDRFAAAEKTFAGGGQAIALLKDKSAVPAGGRLNDQSSFDSRRSGDMGQMIVDFFFPDPDDLGNFLSGQILNLEQGDDGLADGGHNNPKPETRNPKQIQIFKIQMKSK